MMKKGRDFNEHTNKWVQQKENVCKNVSIYRTFKFQMKF